MSPKTRWHVLHYGPAVLLVVLVVPALLLGESPFSAFCVAMGAVVVAINVSTFRARYKNGWHDGRVDLVREMTHDPDYHGTGRAPEPWTPRPAITVGAVHHHHHHGEDDDAHPTDGA